MIASGGKGVGESAENTSAIVMDLGSFAVHDPSGAHNFSTENLTDRLMTKTNSQDREASGEMFDDFHGDPGFFGSPGTGRDQDLPWLKFFDLFEGNGVIAVNGHCRSQFSQILDEIIGKRVIIIDHQQHDIIITRNPALCEERDYFF